MATLTQADPGNGAPAAATGQQGPAQTNKQQENEMHSRFFWIAFGYLIALLTVFALYHTWSGFREALPQELGPLPIGVPWFGALGGALISLSATYRHRRDWDETYDYWHYARPWVGATIGSLGVLILLAIVEASTTTSQPIDGLALYVVAFIVGYRESTFRDLISRASDLLLGPGKKPDAPDDASNEPGSSADGAKQPGPSADATKQPGPSADATKQPGSSADATPVTAAG
jgi:hypothetical protein